MTTPRALSGAEREAILPEELLSRIAVFRGQALEITELSGGLTNRNFKIVTSSGAYVLRLSSAESLELSVDRDNEHANTRLAAESGAGAPVIDYLPDASVLVIGFLEGTTFTDESFQIPGNIPRVARAVRRLHDGPRFVNDFNMFDIQAGYQEKVITRGYKIPADYLDFAPKVAQIKTAFAVTEEGTVPCNNDLLAGNFIDTGDDIRLIDYEYSGNNDACFELGNIWSECHLGEEQLEELVTAYYGVRRESRLARARLQALMSQYGWTLWASIQDATSSIDFDFWSWGLEKYERARATFSSPEFDALVTRAQQAD
jgi:thiamine kinase-like enzyme